MDEGWPATRSDKPHLPLPHLCSLESRATLIKNRVSAVPERRTQKPNRDAQWIGSLLLQRLIAALLREAYEEGTTNWDKTIQKALSLLLVRALLCRSGDIMKDQKDTHPLPFLCYDDITVKLVGGVGIENLEAVFLICNEKKKK
jgi:hypothetical protein